LPLVFSQYYKLFLSGNHTIMMS